MNELRNPTSLLAGTNIVFSVGSFMFLYKRMEQLQNDNIELKKDVRNLTEKLLKSNNDNDQTKELIGKMYKDVKNIKEENASDIMPEELKAIIAALEDHDISVSLPKKKSNKKKKYISSEESSEEEMPKRKNKKKTKDELEDEDIINMIRLKQRAH